MTNKPVNGINMRKSVLLIALASIVMSLNLPVSAQQNNMDSLLQRLQEFGSIPGVSVERIRKTHGYVDLGLSVKWATCNVGASSPEESGTYFAWGETETKTTDYTESNYALLESVILWSGDDASGVIYTFERYNQDDKKDNLESNDDVAHAKWGGNWRMPTKDECQELIDNCTCTWDTINGVYGFRVTSNKTGYEGRSIFLPAIGKGEVVQLYSATKDNKNEELAYVIAGKRDNATSTLCIGRVSRCSAQFVRPVCP